MANVFDAFVDRLIAASSEFNAAPVGQTALIESVYHQVSPKPGDAAGVVRIPFPDFPPFADQGVGDLVISDVNPGYVDISVTEMPAASIKDTDLEAMIAPGMGDAAMRFIDAAWKRGAEYANGRIASFIHDGPGGLNVIPPIISSKLGAIDVDDERDAWDQLVTSRVPLTRYGDARILTHNNVQRNLGMDPNYANASYVGEGRADKFLGELDQGKRAMFMPAWDQQMPTGQTKLSGTVAVTKGSTAVTGTTTQFTTQANDGAYVWIGDDGDDGVNVGRWYRVRKVDSATKLTLAQPFQGETVTGVEIYRRTYISAAMHQYAIATVFAPPRMVNDGNTQSRLLVARDIPFRVQYGYMRQHNAEVLSLHFCFGGKVARPDYGIIIKS